MSWIILNTPTENYGICLRQNESSCPSGEKIDQKTDWWQDLANRSRRRMRLKETAKPIKMWMIQGPSTWWGSMWQLPPAFLIGLLSAGQLRGLLHHPDLCMFNAVWYFQCLICPLEVWGYSQFLHQVIQVFKLPQLSVTMKSLFLWLHQCHLSSAPKEFTNSWHRMASDATSWHQKGTQGPILV